METHYIFYRVYYTAFALLKKKIHISHTLMMTSMDYTLHLMPVSVVSCTICTELCWTQLFVVE